MTHLSSMVARSWTQVWGKSNARVMTCTNEGFFRTICTLEYNLPLACVMVRALTSVETSPCQGPC